LLRAIQDFVAGHGGTYRGAASQAFRRFRTSDFGRKISEIYATRILLMGLSLISAVLVSRILGPGGRGQYSLAMTLSGLGVQFGNFGLHASNTYFVSKDRKNLPSLIGNSILLSFGIGVGGAVLAYGFFQIWPSLGPRGLLLVLALVWIPLGLSYLFFQNLLVGIQEIRSYNKIEVVNRALAVGLTVAGACLLKLDVTTVFAFSLLALGVGLALAFRALGRHAPVRPVFSKLVFEDTLFYGFRAYLSAFFAFLVLKSDILLVNYLLGEEQTGYYSNASSMADMLYQLPVAVGTILFPKLSAMKTGEEKWRFTRKTLLLMLALMAPLVLASGILAKPMIEMLFGSRFLPALPVFWWLLPAVLILSLNTVFMNYFASIGMPPVTVYSPGFSALLNIALNFLWVPRYGIVGASISSVVAYGSMLVFSVLFVVWRRRNIGK